MGVPEALKQSDMISEYSLRGVGFGGGGISICTMRQIIIHSKGLRIKPKMGMIRDIGKCPQCSKYYQDHCCLISPFVPTWSGQDTFLQPKGAIVCCGQKTQHS